MPRWYRGFDCYGKPESVVENIGKLVQRNNLSNVVPVVRVEKQAGHGQFLLFLAIESPIVGEIPERVQSTLLHLPILKKPYLEPFTYEEIRSTVGAKLEFDVHNYAQSIPYPYKRFQSFSDENPFDVLDKIPEQSVDVDSILNRTRHYDQLMIWASANGSGSWNTFQNACQTLGLDNDGFTSRRILRNLRLLGHIETSNNGAFWSVAPTVLARSDSSTDEEEYFVCGQRDIEMLQALRLLTNLREFPQRDGNAPATIQVLMTDSKQLLKSLKETRSIRQLRIAKNLDNRLARLVPPLNDWMNKLEKLDGILPHMFTVKRFSGISFVEDTFHQGKSGFYELWALERSALSNRPQYILFYDAVGNRWLRGDWYGLRFLALQLSGSPCPVRYEPSTCRLAVPKEWRWPELYERVLVLASGQLPIYRNSWLIYDSIGPDLLNILITKLNLNKEEASLNA